MKQEWYRSWAVWLSLLALIAYIVKTIFHEDIAPWLNGLAEVLLPVLVAFGIVNNPNEPQRLNIPAAEIKASRKQCGPGGGVL